jgi:hypothetical protein
MPAFLEGARQLAAALLVLAGYLIVTQGLPVNRSAADARGRWLLRIERPWRLDWGLAANGWLAAHRFPGWLAAWEYATTYVLTTFILLGWLWWRRRQRCSLRCRRDEAVAALRRTAGRCGEDDRRARTRPATRIPGPRRTPKTVRPA